jgi:hypothetical protein
MSTSKLEKVDHTALNTNQAVIIALNITAFILNAPWLAAITATGMIVGTLRRVPGFGFVYRIIKLTGWLKPEIMMDNPEPHRFAQGFGGVVMFVGTLSLLSGAPTVGWGLIWLVAGLAALNLVGGFCVGCAVYYWLSRLKVPGFVKSPPKGTSPGMRSNLKTCDGC